MKGDNMENTPKTIAVIDDDLSIGDLLEELLTREGYSVLRAYSGTEALYLLERNKPDLVLLDLMLPGLSGEQVLPHIQNIPVIVLSAKAQPQDKVKLLLGGAADYLTKPFDTSELLARITVQLRRVQQVPSEALLTAGSLTLDESSHEVRCAGKDVRLTRTEFAILRLLLRNRNRTVAKSVILERIAADTPDCTEDSLKQHVSNLRSKLREAGGKELIQAVWGIGYKLTE